MQLEDGPQEPHVQVPPPLRSDSPLWKMAVVEQRRLSPAAVDTRCGEKTTCLREGTMQIIHCLVLPGVHLCVSIYYVGDVRVCVCVLVCICPLTITLVDNLTRLVLNVNLVN